MALSLVGSKWRYEFQVVEVMDLNFMTLNDMAAICNCFSFLLYGGAATRWNGVI